jgi:hypothetical protein
MSGKTIVVQKEGLLYTVTNTDKDLDDFYSRVKFIFKGTFQSKDEFTQRSKLSNCYLNHKKLGVVYPEHIQSKLN